MSYFHVTRSKNLASICHQGLIPCIGGNSQGMGETVDGVYAFASIEAVEDGLMNWLGDLFGVDEALTIIEFEYAGNQFAGGAGFEVIITENIKPSQFTRLYSDSLQVVRDFTVKPMASDKLALGIAGLDL